MRSSISGGDQPIIGYSRINSNEIDPLLIYIVPLDYLSGVDCLVPRCLLTSMVTEGDYWKHFSLFQVNTEWVSWKERMRSRGRGWWGTMQTTRLSTRCWRLRRRRKRNYWQKRRHNRRGDNSSLMGRNHHHRHHHHRQYFSSVWFISHERHMTWRVYNWYLLLSFIVL